MWSLEWVRTLGLSLEQLGEGMGALCRILFYISIFLEIWTNIWKWEMLLEQAPFSILPNFPRIPKMCQKNQRTKYITKSQHVEKQISKVIKWVHNYSQCYKYSQVTSSLLYSNLDKEASIRTHNLYTFHNRTWKPLIWRRISCRSFIVGECSGKCGSCGLPQFRTGFNNIILKFQIQNNSYVAQ